MGPIEIRLAEPRDDEAVGALLIEAFVEQYAKKMPDVIVTERRKAELRNVAAKRAVATVWVAEREGRLVGTVAIWPHRAPGAEAWREGAADLRHLAVHDSARGTGLSAKLVATAEAWAAQQGHRELCLHVRRGAVGVRRVYERLGYVRDERGDLDLLPEVFLEALWKPLR